MINSIPQHIDKDKIFIVNRSEIEGRLEPNYYRPSISLLEKKVRSLATKKLRDYASSIAGGATPKKTEVEKYYSDAENGVPFLRVQNLQTTGELLLAGCLYINHETHNGLLKRSQVSEGDLLIKITGIGRMAVASVAPKNFIGNTNQHMVVVKTGNADISKYLAQYLNLDIIEKIASRHSTGGTRPALDYPSLMNLPIIEGIDFSSIVNAIKEKNTKDATAQQLLDNIDNYLLSELGITIPQVDTTLDNRIFLSSFHTIEGNRIDPTFTLYLGKNALSTKYENTLLRSIAYIVKGNALSSSEIENGSIPVIAGGQTSPYNHSHANYEGNVITVSASGAYAGYVWYHDYPIYATDCCVIFSKDESCYITKYLFEVLKLQQKSIYRLQTGAAQPHVYASDLQLLNIPIIPQKKQQEIVDYITNIRNKAKALQAEGKEILDNAKRKVEHMIIGM
ncbi:MAG: restriction endonuclease subunit S [Bacteroidetes bacterium]|uniref:Restriction endonuclease subunit S n=1 Tax=Candidatus Cryptobacteroides intestinigallinarum TaxID=2840767 RepID=A0A9D9HJU6_9BACT|nr:restriction endonuclease subunit S [Candidatus Cryptobacteroides intestinigallinarum]